MVRGDDAIGGVEGIGGISAGAGDTWPVSLVFFQVTVGRIGSIVSGGGGGGGISTRREDIYKNGVDHKEEKKMMTEVLKGAN